MDESQNAVTIFNKYASQYQTKFMDVNMYAATFDFFCDQLSPNAEVLELACGPGNITKYLLTKRPDLKILGTDLAPNMIELAKINNPSAVFEIMDSRAIGQLTKHYDAILCGFILPYLSKAETAQLFKDANTVLNEKGIIYISTMEDDYNNSGYRKGSGGDEIFMHFYTEALLTELLSEATLKLMKVERVETTMTDGSKVIDLILIAEKK